MSLARVGVVIAAAAAVVAALWVGWREPTTPRPHSEPEWPLADRSSPRNIARREHDLPEPRNDLGAARAPAEESVDQDMLFPSWEAVDMEEVRRAMPDNIYWDMSAPTQDEAELERRKLERERWNVEYGKVLSGTGTEEDVRDYYDHRARMFGDYIEFTTHLIEHYGETLSERDLGMLMLARKLSQARIEEIPRKVEEGLARTRAQMAAREAWKADQELFAEDNVPDENIP